MKPDYQVIRDGEYFSVYKPVRLLALPDGGMISLMYGYDDTWCVFSDAKGIAKRSTVYRSKTFGESAWQQLCGELTKREKERLANVALDTSLTGQERGDAAVELVRLEMADDEKCDEITAEAQQFCAMHSKEEVEAYIVRELAAYHESQAADREEKG